MAPLQHDSAGRDVMEDQEVVWMPRLRWILPLIAIAHLLLAFGYARETPYREAGILRFQGRAPAQDIGAPDERQHVNYVHRLARGEGFPVFDPKDPNLYETYQSHQPPLYYLKAAGWAKMLGLDILSESGGRGLRLQNAIIGAGTVVGVFFLVYWGFRRVSASLIASAFAALLPMNVALSGAVGNDPLLIFFCTWTLGLCALGLRDGWTVGRAVALGVLVGLAALTKTTAVALMPVASLALLWPSPRRWNLFALAGGIALLIPMGWWIRNQQLYGDPLAIGAFNEAFVGSPKASMFIGELGALDYWLHWVGWWTARSFFGVFGYMDIFLPDTLYRLLMAGMLVIVLLWFLSLTKGIPKEEARVHWLNGLFLLIVLALFLRFNMQYFQAQARYIMPALGVIAAGVGIGLASSLRGRWPMGLYGLMALLLGLNLYILSWLPGQFEQRLG